MSAKCRRHFCDLSSNSGHRCLEFRASLFRRNVVEMSTKCRRNVDEVSSKHRRHFDENSTTFRRHFDEIWGFRRVGESPDILQEPNPRSADLDVETWRGAAAASEASASVERCHRFARERTRKKLITFRRKFVEVSVEISPKCQRTIHEISTKSRRKFNEISTTCQRNVVDMSTTLKRNVDGVSAKCRRNVEEVSSIIRQNVNDISTKYRLNFLDFSAKCRRCFVDMSRNVDKSSSMFRGMFYEMSSNCHRIYDEISTTCRRNFVEISTKCRRNDVDISAKGQRHICSTNFPLICSHVDRINIYFQAKHAKSLILYLDIKFTWKIAENRPKNDLLKS